MSEKTYHSEIGNYDKEAEALPTGEYEGHRYVVQLSSWYSDKGVYYMAHHSYDIIRPHNVATIRGEVPPQDTDKFNQWLVGLTRSIDGFQFYPPSKANGDKDEQRRVEAVGKGADRNRYAE